MSELDHALDALRERAQQGLGVDPVSAEPTPDRRFADLAGDRTEVVRCDDLAREIDPHAKLLELREQLGSDGIAVIGATQLASPEHSALARFGRGQDGLWLIPGRLCFRRQLEAAGLVVEAESEPREGSSGLVHAYLRARPGR